MTEYKLMNIYDLIEHLNNQSKFKQGLLFCFGTSFISKLIQAKTKNNPNELVPSHIAMIVGNHVYESTTSTEKVGYKKIKGGVRRWLLDDFFEAEKSKLTRYIFIPEVVWEHICEEHVHLPYGKDTILDFVLKDGSDGDSHGLICSQYANLCIKYPMKSLCPSPAELMRFKIKTGKVIE